MATSTKTSKPPKIPLSARPHTRIKANVGVATAMDPKPSKTKATTKRVASVDTKAKPVKTKTGVKVQPAILSISNEDRHRHIELAAFYIAERRSFIGGNTLKDWLQAEAEIDQLLRQGKINR
ncbi:hypothetical protein GALL_280540 [mine drainage metagenome]|uniref:DUF2934 domain-containing protein n=1 Tax=mine drainage metagenome TaxID=410659 RepID=A0A1J5RDG1_9ZZZZ